MRSANSLSFLVGFARFAAFVDTHLSAFETPVFLDFFTLSFLSTGLQAHCQPLNLGGCVKQSLRKPYGRCFVSNLGSEVYLASARQLAVFCLFASASDLFPNWEAICYAKPPLYATVFAHVSFSAPLPCFVVVGSVAVAKSTAETPVLRA